MANHQGFKVFDETPHYFPRPGLQLAQQSLADEVVPNDIKALFDDSAKGNHYLPRPQTGQSYFLSDYSYSQEPTHASSHITTNISSQQFLESQFNFPQPEIRVVELNNEVKLRDMLECNKTCPFCGELMTQDVIEPFKVIVFFVTLIRKQYLAHRNCYMKSNANLSDPRIIPNLPHFPPKINFYSVPTPLFHPNNYSVNEKKSCFVSIEGFHPISSYQYFKIEKICSVMQHNLKNSECLLLDFMNKSTNILEPLSYKIPYEEFRIALSLHVPSPHGDSEDPYKYEFIIDLSGLPESPNNEPIHAEALYCHFGNNITLSFQVSKEKETEEDEEEVKQPMRSSLPIFNSLQQGLPLQILPTDFSGSNTKEKKVVVTLKQLAVSLPLRKMFSPNDPHFKPEMQIGNPIAQSFLTSSNYSQKPNNEENYLLRSDLTTATVSSKGHDQRSAKHFSVTSLSAAPFYCAGKAGISTMPNSMNDTSPYFRFNAGQKEGGNNVGRFPAPAPFGRQSLGNSQEMYYKNDESPLLVRSNPFPLEISFQKKSMPSQFNLIEGRESSVSENFSASKVSGNYLSKLPTLKSIDSGNNSPKTARSIQSLYGDELDEQIQMQNEIIDFGTSIHVSQQKEPTESSLIDDYLGRIEDLAKSYQGSKMLQQFISRANQGEIDQVIREIGGRLEELILDPYANYMVQTLMQNCSSEQRYRLLQRIAPSMIKIACHKKGTHSLQVIVTLMHKEAEHQIIKEAFKDCVADLAVDPCATHVIQKLITIIPIENIDFIYEPLVRNFLNVAKHSYGILVIKHLMSKIEKTTHLKKRIIDIILENFENLIQDPCGNYTIQYALEFYPYDCEAVLEKILVRVISYSSQKFSSNVIEKCLSNVQPAYLKRVIGEIMKGDRLADLMKNKYGNYVLLHVLLASTKDDKERIMQGIFKYTNSFHGTKYKERWSEFLEENPLNIEWSGPKGSPNSSAKLKNSRKEESKESPTIEPMQFIGIKQADLEKVKKIWRTMNKKEKKEVSLSNSLSNSEIMKTRSMLYEPGVNNGENQGYPDYQYISRSQGNWKGFKKGGGNNGNKGKNEGSGHTKNNWSGYKGKYKPNQ